MPTHRRRPLMSRPARIVAASIVAHLLSHAEMIANHFIRQLVDGAAGDTPSFFENAELARHALGEAQLLLDQEHRDSRFPVEREKNIADLVHDIGLNPFSWLVEN